MFIYLVIIDHCAISALLASVRRSVRTVYRINKIIILSFTRGREEEEEELYRIVYIIVRVYHFCQTRKELINPFFQIIRRTFVRMITFEKVTYIRTTYICIHRLKVLE